MQLEVGSILEGKVTGITKFGAFVELEDGKTGMVHISEVAPTFVNDIKEHLKEGDVVKVKVLALPDDGKISLSIKRAMPMVQKPENQQRNNNNRGNFQNRNNSPRPNNFRRDSRPQNQGYVPPKKVEPTTFEDMMNKFKQTSDEKFSDLKKINEGKRGGYSRRSNGSNRI